VKAKNQWLVVASGISLVDESKKSPAHENDGAAGVLAGIFCMGESQNLTRKSKYNYNT
jgi:hypothetical protein